MNLKSTVKLDNLSTQILLAMFITERLFVKLGFEFTITSVSDGKHSVASLHYIGNAFDIRTRHLPESVNRGLIVNQLKSLLTSDYDVVYEHNTANPENEHIHVEYQPKRK